MSNEYIATLELAAKLAKKENAVMMACQSIPKRGAFNYGRQNWNYVTPEDLIDATAPALDTNGVRISTQITDIAVSGAQAIISFVFTVTDCETGYSEARLWTELHPVGDLKPQTMGAIKTYALKNFLYATYLVAGRDDADNLTPDNVESVQPQYNNAPRPQPQRQQNGGNDKQQPTGQPTTRYTIKTVGNGKRFVIIDNAGMDTTEPLEMLGFGVPVIQDLQDGDYELAEPVIIVPREYKGSNYINAIEVVETNERIEWEYKTRQWVTTSKS